MATVTFDHVTKKYGDVTAVDDLDLEIADGEFMVLVGPSGCGKTTSLRMIAGLEEITAGTLRIGDKVVNDVAPKDRDIAMVFQSYALYPHMTVYDNLAFGLKLRKVPKADIDKRVKDAAEILDLGKLLARKPKELSGGQRQRVALGRAIVREPAVFLMDEPLSNLDAKLRVQTRAEIARLHQRLKTTVVYVTHDQVEAMTMGTRIAVMSDGLLQQVGTPQALYDTPVNRFVAGFIGSPAMNFVDVVIDRQRRRLDPRRGRLQRAAAAPLARVGRSDDRPEARRGDPARAPRHRDGRRRRREHPGQGRRRRVPRQRGAPPRDHRPKELVAVVGAEHRVRPGDILNLVVPLVKLHVFDAETGASLASDAAWPRPPDRAPGHAAASPPTDSSGRPGERAIDPFVDRASDAELHETTVESRVIHEGRTLTFRRRHRRAHRRLAPRARDRRSPRRGGHRRRRRRRPGPARPPVPAGGRPDAARDPGRNPRRRPRRHDRGPGGRGARELEEETGQQARTWQSLGCFWPAPGFSPNGCTSTWPRACARPIGRRGPDDDEAPRPRPRPGRRGDRRRRGRPDPRRQVDRRAAPAGPDPVGEPGHARVEG